MADQWATEQQYVTRLYDRLDEVREWTAGQLTEWQAAGPSGTPQNRSERDAFAAQYEDRLAQLNAVENGLVFGRLDRADGERAYIGRIGLSDEQYARLLVDWRAPAAQPFYRATPAAPMDVTRRRHLRLRGRQVVGVDDDVLDLDQLGAADRSTLSGEAALLASLTAGRTGRMSDIVATIQSEQDRVIRADERGVLVVQGGPGTGKTAVALHRAAYLLYTFRDRLARAGVLVVGPNPVFLRYIAQVLPSLGETGVLLATPDQLLPGVTATATEPDDVAALKGDPRLAGVVAAAALNRKRVPVQPVEIPFGDAVLVLTRRAAIAARAAALRSGRPHNASRSTFVRRVLDELVGQVEGGRSLSAADGRELRRELLRTDQLAESLAAMWPLLTPQELIGELYVSPIALAAAAPDLSEDERALLARPAGGGWTAADVPLLDEAAELLGDHEGVARALERRRTREAERGYAQGVLDITGMGAEVDADELAARFRDDGPVGTVAERAAADRSWAFGHVVVDEAQELSAMAWRMLMRRCPSRSMTVVGDVAQTSSESGAQSWAGALDPFVAGRWRLAELTVNYRTPQEITEVAADVLAVVHPDLPPPTSVRSAGHQPRAFRLDAAADPAALAALVRDEERAVADESGGTVAILVPPARRDELAAALRTYLPRLAVGAAADAADARILLLGVDQAKGLEFDAVVVVDPEGILASSARGAGALYVALTRATRRLTVVHRGDLPAMLHRLEPAD